MNELLDRLRAAGLVKEAFGSRPEPMTSERIQDIFRVSWATEGSRRRQEEQDVMARFLDILQDFEGACRLKWAS